MIGTVRIGAKVVVSNYLGRVGRVHAKAYVETVPVIISKLEIEARGTAYT